MLTSSLARVQIPRTTANKVRLQDPYQNPCSHLHQLRPSVVASGHQVLYAQRLTRNRKDKTLVEILDRLKNLQGEIRNLDGKVDNLNIRSALPLSGYGSNLPGTVSGHSGAVVDSAGATSWAPGTMPLAPTIGNIPGGPLHYRYVSGAYKMLSW